VGGQRLGVADVDQAREQLQGIEEARPARGLRCPLRLKDSMPEARPPTTLHQRMVGMVFSPA
jgi:hypothetical protein